MNFPKGLYLNGDGACEYHRLSYALADLEIIGETEFFSNMVVLHQLLDPRENWDFAHHLNLVKNEYDLESDREYICNGEEADLLRDIEDGYKSDLFSTSDERGKLFDDGMMHLMVNLPKNGKWVFHQYDADPFPSVPHGHKNDERAIKLHAYQGWIYKGTKQIDRLSRRSIINLWNDDKFRIMASSSIERFITNNPRHKWEVRFPLRLPRRV